MTLSPAIEDLSPAAIHELMQKQAIILIDVREPAEFAAERIPGALLFPLSTFDAACLPAPSDRPVVFHCGSGKRSVDAVRLCGASGIAHVRHMTGGISAWKQSGLPVIAFNPASGRIEIRR